MRKGRIKYKLTFAKDPFSEHSVIGVKKGLFQSDVYGDHFETAPSTTSLFRPAESIILSNLLKLIVSTSNYSYYEGFF